MSRVDFVPFDLRERNPEALEEILENRKRINDFWDGTSRTLEYTNELLRGGGGKFERLKKVRRRSSANIKFQEKLLTSSLQDKHLFHPMGPNKTIWDLFIALLILYSAVTVPYRIAFTMNDTESLTILDELVNYFFLFDIAVSFNTAIIDRQTELLVPYRMLITVEYLKFWFWIDLISAFPFETLLLTFHINSGNLDAVVLVRLLRLARIFKLLRVLKLGKFSKQLERFNINPVYFSALQLLLVLWFCGHTVACVWIIVGQEASKRTWMTVAPFGDISHYNAIETYGVSFYWVVYTALSVGYGEFIPVNKLERIITMLLELSGGIIFGTVLAQITRVLETSNPHAAAYKLKIEELQNYLQERKLPLVLKSRITNAYKYYISTKSVFDEEMIMRDLPTVMLTRLVEHSYQKQFNNFLLFKQLEKTFAVNILVSSKPFQAEFGEIILSNGAVTSEIVFLNRGLVQFSTVSKMSLTTVTGYCTDGEFFGDFEYYRKTNRFMSYRAKTHCSLFSVEIRALENAFKLFPVSGKIFHEKVSNRYEQFLKAKISEPMANEYGVCIREELWVNGQTVKSKYRLDDRIARRSIEVVKQRRPSAEKLDVNMALHGHAANIRILTRLNDGSIAVAGEPSEDVLFSRYIIPPQNEWKVRWDIFIGVLILFSIIIIPVEVGFFVTFIQPLVVVDYIVDALFFIDMLLATRTAYYDESHDALVSVPSLLLKRYLRTWFLTDFLSFFPFSVIFGLIFNISNTGVKTLGLLKSIRFLRLARVAKFSRIAQKMQEKFSIDLAVFEVFKLVVQFLFVSHVIACVYWYLSTMFGGPAWYDEFGLRHAELKSQYVTTLYFIVTTLSGVGYGDITPTTPSERLTVTLMMFLGSSTIGYVIANVRLMINTADASEWRVARKMRDVSGYLSEKFINGPLEELVFSQMKHAYKYGSTKTEREILRVLPQFLVNRIISIHHGDTLNRITLFQYIDDNNVVLYLFPMLTSRVYSTGDVISSQGSRSTDITFLTKGTANIIKKWKLPPIKRGRRKSRDPVIRRPENKLAWTKSISDKMAQFSPKLSHRQFGDISRSYSTKSSNSSKSAHSGYSRKTHMNSLKIRPLSFRGKIMTDDSIYKEKLITSVRAPDFFGLISLVTGTAQTVTVRAAMACTTFTLNESDVRSLITENPTVAMILKDALANAYLGQREKLKNELRAKRFVFLRECKNDFYDTLDKNYMAGANESSRSRKGLTQRGRRGSFSSPQRGFGTSSQKRASLDNSPNATFQRRGSFDTERKGGVNIISPHSSRRRFNFGEVAGMVRSLSTKALPFLRGDSERTSSFGSQRSMQGQLHPDLLAQIQQGNGLYRGRPGMRDSKSSMDSGGSSNSLNPSTPKQQLSRKEIISTLETRGSRKKLSLSIARQETEMLNDNYISDSQSPSSSTPMITSQGGLLLDSPLVLSQSDSEQQFPLVANLVTGETGAADEEDEIPPPPLDSPCESAPQSPDHVADKKRLTEQKSFYLELPPDDEVAAIGVIDSKEVSSGVATENQKCEDALVSLDEKDIMTPRTLLEPLPRRQSSKTKFQTMPTIPPSPSHSSSFSGFNSPDIDNPVDKPEKMKPKQPTINEDIEAKSVPLVIKPKPKRRNTGDIISPKLLLNAKHLQSSLTSNDITPNGLRNEDPPKDQTCHVNEGNVMDDATPYPHWQKHIRVNPISESSERKDGKEFPAPIGSPWSQRMRQKIIGVASTSDTISGASPPSTRRSSHISNGAGFNSVRQQRSVGLGDVVNVISGKTTSGRRASLHATQIVNTFRMLKKKPVFDPGKVEFGYYDSEDDTDELDPPIIYKTEIQIRRVESATDLTSITGKTFKDVVMQARARRLTFPATNSEKGLYKNRKLLQMTT